MKTDPTIQEALDAGEDTTGLGTVKDLVRLMLESPLDVNGFNPMEMVLNVDGKKVNIEVTVTWIDGVQVGPMRQSGDWPAKTVYAWAGQDSVQGDCGITIPPGRMEEINSQVGPIRKPDIDSRMRRIKDHLREGKPLPWREI